MMIDLSSDRDSHLRLYSAECASAELGDQGSVEPSASAMPASIDLHDFLPPIDTVDLSQSGHRFESVLRAAAELTGCQAAALYLLDDATSNLSMRHAFNLPVEAMVAPPRLLSESLADLEALSGSAVALEDNSLYPYWRVPQASFGAAVCVPVSCASTILGTLWVFSEKPRPFSATDTHLVEVIAGRMAADLRYDTLCQETVNGARLERQWTEAAQQQSALQPAPPSLPGGWEVAGWSSQAEGIGGAMFDWLCDEQDNLKLVAAQAMERGLTAALGAASLRTSLRQLCLQTERPAQILTQAGKAMWAVSGGDQFAAALVGSLNPWTGDLRYSAAGRMHAVLIEKEKNRRLALDAPPLGVDPDLKFTGGKTNIARGATVAIFTDGAAQLLRDRRRSAEANVARTLHKFHNQSLAEQVAAVGRATESTAPQGRRSDAAIVVLRRPVRV